MEAVKKLTGTKKWRSWTSGWVSIMWEVEAKRHLAGELSLLPLYNVFGCDVGTTIKR